MFKSEAVQDGPSLSTCNTSINESDFSDGGDNFLTAEEQEAVMSAMNAPLTPLKDIDSDDFSRDALEDSEVMDCLMNSSITRHFNNERPYRRSSSVCIALDHDMKGRLQAPKPQHIEGTPLSQWIRDNPYSSHENPTSEELLDRACVAAGIAGAVADANESGAVKSEVIPSSFLIMDDLKNMVRRPVKSIKFSHSEYNLITKPTNVTNMNDDEQRLNNNLFGLGLTIRALFSEDWKFFEGDDGHTDDFSELRGNCKSGFDQNPLPKNLPQSIKTLLSRIFDKHESDRKTEDLYRSSREVEEDLIQMIEDPDVFFYDPSPDTKLNKLLFSSSKLYGRSKEVSILRGACQRISKRDKNVIAPIVGENFQGKDENDDDSRSSSCDSEVLFGNTELALVYGQPGTGKSELVNRACRSTIEGMNGCFVRGKFDQLRRAQPYSALIVAFNELCEDILTRSESDIKCISKKIQMALGKLGKVVTNVIPNLTKIIGIQPELPPELEGLETLNRFNHTMTMFARVIATPDHPVVLVLDDLQWADSASLNLIKILAKDVRNPSMLIVGCFRNNEISESHPLAILLNELELKGIEMSKIVLQDLDKDVVNHLVSDVLRTPRSSTKLLAEIVHRKTNGNAFFVVEFLKSLSDENIISYNAEARRWQWQEKELETRTISNKVIEVIAAKIKKIPKESQDVIKIAAGIGSYFDSQMVRLVMKEKIITRDWCGNELECLSNEGLICKSKSGRYYKFANDRIQEAAYSLIPEYERDLLHLQIGQIMLRRCCLGSKVETNSDILFFSTADQLNRGAAFLTKQEEKIKVAKLNLRAGEMAMQSSAFGPASEYLNAGLRMLDSNRWKFHYDLTLRLYSNIAKSEYCNGFFESVEKAVGKVFSHGRSIEDKFPAYLSLMMAASLSGDMHKAVSIGLVLLDQLGESFPSKVTMRAIMMDLMKTKSNLKGKSDEALLSLPMMNDHMKELAMFILSKLYIFASQGPMDYVPIFVNRMVRLTLRYGISEASAIAFAMYGNIMCEMVGDVVVGGRYGQLGLELSGRLKSNKWIVRVLCVLVCNVWVWTKPYHQIIEPCLRVYNMGMDVGDNESAMSGLCNFSMISILTGKPLLPLADDMRSYRRIMVDIGPTNAHSIFLPLFQCVLNLTGYSENPVFLTGEAMTQEQFLMDCNSPMATSITYVLCLMMAYLFESYEVASAMIEKSKDIPKVQPGSSMICVRTLFEGLTSFAMAIKTGEKKWQTSGRKMMVLMKKWAEISPDTFFPKYKLLVAEDKSIKGKTASVLRLYDVAINVARKSGLINDEALANERAGIFLRKRGDNTSARQYFERANKLYSDWGAHSKWNKNLTQG